MPRERTVGINHGGSTGLLSSVFSFVSREIDSFVSTATGRPPCEEEEYEDDEDYEDDEEDEPAQASSSHAALPGRKSKFSEHVDEDKTRRHGRERRYEEPTTSRLRSRSRRRECEASDSGDDPRKKARCVGSSFSTTPRPRRRRPAPSIEDEEELATSDGSHSPVKSSPSHIRRKRSHFTMPGALYDRTSSLEPTPEPEDGRTRHVRFASEVTESPSPRKQTETPRTVRRDSETEAGPSSGRRTPLSSERRAQNQTNAESSSEDEMMPSSPIKRVPRPRRNGFVQEAILQRSVERNPDVSLLLPKSPIAVYSSPPKGKGKEKALAPEIISISDSEGDSSDAGWNHSNQADLSVRTRVKGKEKELRTARQRESSGVDDEERRRDKERIRVLEEELRKLREELAKRPVVSEAYFVPPPPPPPPPPRPPVVSRPQATEPTSAFAQVRASLRRTETPVEKPINPAYGAPSLRKGQPTINLGADKMAAFLNELKTHRLRRVGRPEDEGSSMVQPSRSQPAVRVREVGDIGNRSEVVFRPREIEDIGNRSEVLQRPNRNFAVPVEREYRRTEFAVNRDEEPAETAIRTGGKRKHVETSNGATQDPLPKRRALATSFHTADTSGDSFASVSASSRNPRLPIPSGRHDHPNAFSNIVQPRPIRPVSDTSSSSRTSSGIRAETDITTPSLSSDNEQDSGSNESQERRLPPTPPPEDSTSLVVPNKGANSEVTNVHDADDVEEVNVEMYRPEQQRSRTRSILRQQQSPEMADTFSRRAPASPRLLDSPRRPRPPTRPRLVKEISGAVDDDVDVDSEPLSMSYGSVDAHSFSLSQIDESRVERDPQTTSRLGLPVRPPPGMFKPPTKKTNPRSRLPIRKGMQKIKPATASALAQGNTSILSSVPTATKRRESLDAELRRAEMEADAEAAYDAEISHEDVQLESGTFAGRGTRERKQGFLAFGGAGGPPAVMRDGSFEGLEHSEDEEYAREVELPVRRRTRRV